MARSNAGKAGLSLQTDNSQPITPVTAPLATPKTPADEGKEFFMSDVGVSDEPIRVYELRLDPDGGPNRDRSYIRLPPAYVPYILRVSLDAGTPASRNGLFKTNFPLDGGAFGRDKFCERKLPTDFSKPIRVDLPISHAGAFKYWVEYDDGAAPGERIRGREGYFNIDPILRTSVRKPILSPDLKPLSPTDGGAKVTFEKTNLPLDGLAIVTLVSKWMGPISGWHKHFAEASDRGYTMIHWTPLQERGHSDSPYSIRDQLKYDPSAFEDNLGADGGKADMERILKIAQDEYGLLGLTDVVLNHTADDTPWLKDHPEAGYSPKNTPHLAPALELDTAIIEFSATLAANGLPTQIASSDDIDKLITALEKHLESLDMWQYYALDVTAEKKSVRTAIEDGKVTAWKGDDVAGNSVVSLAQSVIASGIIDGYRALGSRFGTKTNGATAAGLTKAAFVNLGDDAEALAEAWGRIVDVINVDLYAEWKEDTKIAIESIKNRVRYTRLDKNGPNLGEITRELPLVEAYFTRISPGVESDPFTYSLANNGWIWNADPLQNFALPPSKAYLRREVIVWGDCVKLRYGDSPSDNPWLWSHMQSYVESLAQGFQGFRIDNCHSTPLNVGIHMLDAARVVNPNLYVCAELFTGSEDMDLVFVRQLGINSLVREAGNAWDPKEFSRILYRYGLGKPIGSMDGACLLSKEELQPPFGSGPTRQCEVSPLNGSMPHALLYDLTHDNESYLDKRSAEDALSTAGLVTFASCAIGSVKGFDDLYPKLLHLVAEKRQYELTNQEVTSGIARAKRLLNNLRREMILGDYYEGHVHQENDYIVMHRVQPSTQKGYVLVAHTAFSKGSKDRGFINPIKLRRTKANFIFGASVGISSYDTPKDDKLLKGLPSQLLDIAKVVVPQGLDEEGPYCEIIVPEYFPPGSIMIFETQLQGYDQDLDSFCASGAQEAFDELDLVDLNVILYRADGEERDATGGEFGVYNVPGLGKFTYCGLEGWIHPLRRIMQFNDLGHPLCAHLRDGTWSFDYIQSRLVKQVYNFPRLTKPAEWFKARFDRIKASVPPFMRPKYFALVISEAYKTARRCAIEQCSEFVSTGHDFTQALALCSVQMHGMVHSASLDPSKPTPSLAAGLPHFTTSWARCWGRDVFISLRGLFLTTGNFEGARKHILAFASTLKHGLIPNLLDSVRNPRYNSRDSPWWMVQNIQDYVNKAPDGISILFESVKRRFPKDDTWVPWNDPKAYAYSSTIAEILQEILQRHADGISFREHNAGPNLDMQMRDEGFNIDIKVDWSTGIIFGGNAFNCGTWMDKMGESEKAGTKGLPGSPRDGAPIEITGLLKSTLRWLAELSTANKFPFKGVEAKISGKRVLVTYEEWNNLLQESFEKCYYIPADRSADSAYNLDPKLVNRRGIYKDVYGSGAGREWSDYQLRPNFPIAMVVAPELFNEEHALGALRIADEWLRSPLGMKTLDPGDMQYRPTYDNSNDSDDAATAKGRNYHNGPEWGWPLGYFLQAYLHFDTQVGSGKDDPTNTLHHLHKALLSLREHIINDPWAGIPELTNKDGAYCADSCNTQAWSSSTLLDFLEAVHMMGSNEH
ncbi:glycoside hydrolase family 13 protein [Coniophora puteana RWD-64-598 SS2]|uniref:Glycogen debranching enzyme n=1 Tax=Coniophora puteana (strain RWD-64-598) TaxID=741705 RepID=A0A5M3MKC4_CONPW|nr:glycoside hydrolase family 13 protein [Coniophora puteana RWD-64-598 SS2]EIW79274.1 glycoside hydrolase family 13 protein [Coniophora puteana RWD-64-598 SS2]